MLVPTVDTVRFSYLLEACLDVQRSVLFTGVTGVGKSVISAAALEKLAAAPQPAGVADSGCSGRVAGRLLAHTVVFSAQTSSIDTQLLIESKLEKKRKTRCGGTAGCCCVDEAGVCGGKVAVVQQRSKLDCDPIDHNSCVFGLCGSGKHHSALHWVMLVQH